MRLFIYSTALSIFFGCSTVFAQNSTVSVRVKSAGQGVAVATVSLLRATDSSWIKSDITNDSGLARIREVPRGKYLVATTAIGYKTNEILIEVGDKEMTPAEVLLEKESTALKEVAITAKKPFIEVSLGKTIVNIDGSTTTSGADVLDLLRRLPGVSVDRDGSISILGKDGLLVLIDEHPTYLAGEDLAEYLKTITADGVSQIELITQPGAKYDASGNTGVINIRLKKNRAEGRSGNLSLSYGVAVYHIRHEDFTLNYKKNRLSLSVNGSDMEGVGFADWHEQLYLIDAQSGMIANRSSVHSCPVEHYSNTSLRLAADYRLNDKTTAGVNVRGSYHPNTMPTDLSSIDSDLLRKSVFFRDEVMRDFSIRKDIGANAYFTRTFGKDRTLDINLDYLIFNKLSNQDYVRSLTDVNGLLAAAPLMLNSHQPQTINVYSIKADYSATLDNGIKMETGLKSSLVRTIGDARFYRYTGGSWVSDTGMTNHFLYNENINSAYLSAAKNIGKKWEAKLGLRVEQTRSVGTQYVHFQEFSKNYLSPFPTAFIGYRMDSFSQFEINYGRRIDRPSYASLNPFIYHSFQDTYQQGNPYLQPQYTNSAELKHIYRNMLITKVTYSGTTDVITDLLEVRGSDSNVYNVVRNLASNSYVAGSVTFNKDVCKWFSANATAIVFTAEYSGLVNNADKTVHWSGYSVNASGQFDFRKGWKATFYVNYYSAGRKDINEKFDGHTYMEFGASKKMSERLIFKFSTTDPFELDQLHIHINAGNFREDVSYRYASRLFALSFTYNFGKKQHEVHELNDIDEAKRI